MSNRFEKSEDRDESAVGGDRTARPPLHLKTSPGIGSDIDQDLDEMVPEFMHRGFYRSEEELTPIEGGSSLKPLRRKVNKQIDLYDREADEDLESDSVLDTVVVEHNEADSAAPVRAGLEPIRTVTVPQLALYPSKPSAPGPLPRPVETKNLSLPLVVGFLLVVGLFLWREQTRPQLETPEALAVPRTVTVNEQIQPNPDLLGESPYPINEATPLAQPRQVESDDPVSPDLAAQNPQQAPAPIPELDEAELDEDNLVDRERDAQRAAILSRVSDGTVSRGQSDARSSSSIAPARPARIPESAPSAPPEDLFPVVGDSADGPAPIPPAPDESEGSQTKKPYKRQPLEERVQVDPADMAPIPPGPARRAPVAAQTEPERPSSIVSPPPQIPAEAAPVIEPIPELPAEDTNYEISEPTL